MSRDHRCFDLHSDIPYAVVRERAAGRRRVIADEFRPEMAAAGIAGRVVAVYVDEAYLPELALRRALGAVEAIRKEVEETEQLSLATTAEGLDAAAERDRHALVLGMEGAEALKGDRSMLDAFYRLGLRVLTLTHSRRNAAGDGSFFAPTRSGTPGGLSAFGVEVVERADELGVLVDVSHLNEPGFWDVLEFADGPVIASHSNCRALRNHPRNLTDDQLAAVADAGGVVGLTAVGRFLAAPGEGSTVEDYLDHVEHAVDVVGPDHVGVGFDFVEYLRPFLSDAERARLPDPMPVEGLRGDADVADLGARLAERGFGDDAVARILRDNSVRVLRAVLGE
ncbi:dipeptidase [Halorussus marinus]|uniref:dipeptidase n=1 Tax=Halorussus marinus TaxID=2505976 RepID=UPI00106E1CA0|nr:dipeptidase [Halorussus marinus]